VTVTIHTEGGPAATARLVRLLVHLADGNRAAVRSGHGGVVVTDAVALAYLQRDAPPPPATRTVMTPNLARVARDAEGRGGLLTPREPDSAQQQQIPARPAKRPGRRVVAKQGAPS